MGDQAPEGWSEYRLMILDRLSRIDSSINGLSAKIDNNHSTLETRVAILEREWSQAKGKSAAWSTMFGFAAGIAAAVIKEVLFR